MTNLLQLFIGNLFIQFLTDEVAEEILFHIAFCSRLISQVLSPRLSMATSNSC